MYVHIIIMIRWKDKSLKSFKQMWETSFAKQLWYSLLKARTYYKEMYSNFSFSRFYWYYKKSRIRQSSLNGNIELGRETGLQAKVQNVPYTITNNRMCVVLVTYNICYCIYTISYHSLYSSTSPLKVSLPIAAARLQC